MKIENKDLLLEMINYLSYKTESLNYLKKIFRGQYLSSYL